MQQPPILLRRTMPALGQAPRPLSAFQPPVTPQTGGGTLFSLGVSSGHWPVPHLVMFIGMVLFHLFGMPLFMLDSLSDFYISLNQIYMAIAMGTVMVMLEAIMHPMPWKWWTICLSALIAVYLAIRMQWFVGDRQFLRDMIPHHSMALLTAKYRESRTTDGNVRLLAKSIQDTQRKEMTFMRSWLGSH